MIDNLKREGVNFLKKRYRTVLSKVQGSMFSTDFEDAILPEVPMKYSSNGFDCLTSYSVRACLHAPHGGIGVFVGFLEDPATIAIRSIF